MQNHNDKMIEIIIGILAPLGADRQPFLDEIGKYFQTKDYAVERISLTKSLFDFSKIKSKSYKYYLKMELCREIRKEVSKGFFASYACYLISKRRKRSRGKIVYIIDQIKNKSECEILSHVYGLNYIQVTLFSNEAERDKVLLNKFSSDLFTEESGIDPQINYGEEVNKIFEDSKLEKIIADGAEKFYERYKKEVLPDVTHKLMQKDFSDGLNKKDSGQQISKLCHRSHYYFNLDFPQTEINKELKKFTKQLLGQYKEYPRQDEFGMSLAYQVSVRSNFPGERHVGAAIISSQGEVLSIASIRAPSKSSNTQMDDQLNVAEGYKKYKQKIQDWIKQLEDIKKSEYREVIEFLNDSLDFHPCTHAEIAAIIDAAKVGIPIRDATLYTTTFPCHLCAKEIINAGIAKVVYLEAYPKSKNKELYPHSIDFDPWHKINQKSTNDLIPFYFYQGIGPKRFLDAYSLKNKGDRKNNLPPLFRNEHPEYYEKKERDVIDYMKNKIKLKSDDKELSFLMQLFGDEFSP